MSYFNLYSHNFIRAAAAIPEVRVADPAFNAARTVELMREAAQQRAVLVVFPELGLSAYSCEDLFHQHALLDAATAALEHILSASVDLPVVAIVGVPLRIDGLLYNCAAVVSRGRIIGVAPKTFLPNYREYYELRQFTPGDVCAREAIDIAGQRDVPFGNRLLFQAQEQPLLTFFAEICEDLWTPIPPSSYAAMAGATVLVNLSASNITIGKDEYRRQLVGNQSGRCIAAYHLLRGRLRRIDHRRGVGWPCHDLRERLARERKRALCVRVASGERRYRSGPHCSKTACGTTRSANRFRAQPRSNVFGASSLRYRCPRMVSCLCSAATSAFPMCRPIRSTRDQALPRGIRDSSAGARQALASMRRRQGRDRHLGRPGFDACAHRLRARNGCHGIAAREYLRLHDAGLCHQRANVGPVTPVDERSRLHGT